MQNALNSFRKASDLDSLWAATVSTFRKKGVAQFCAVRLHVPDQHLNPHADVAMFGYPEAFVKTYVAKQMWRYDPVALAATTTLQPFCRAERDTTSPPTPEEIEYGDLRAAHGLQPGLIISVFGPRACNGFAELVTHPPCEALSSQRRYELQAIAQMAHQRYCEIEGIESEEFPHLSEREHEVLYWVAQGKSNSIIADILEISASTVDTHLRRIYRKLGVRDRTRAAVRGISLGLITA